MTTPDRQLAEHIAGNLNIEVLPMVRTRRDLDDHPLDNFQPLDVDQLLATHRHLTGLAERYSGEIHTWAEVSTIGPDGREVMIGLDGGGHNPDVWANAALCAAAEYLCLTEALREAADRFIAITACANPAIDQEVPAS